MARRSRFEYQRIALDGRELPVPCDRCGEPVVDFHGGNSGDPLSGEVHHLDGDSENNARSNLEIIHHSCHTSAHMKGVPKSTSHRAALSASWNDERRAAQAEINKRVWTGRSHSAESRAKMSETRLNMDRTECELCGRIWSPAWLERHRREGLCVAGGERRTTPEETRAKMRGSRGPQRRATCDRCGTECALNKLTRHRCVA